jgi:hypothetical protein
MGTTTVWPQPTGTPAALGAVAMYHALPLIIVTATTARWADETAPFVIGLLCMLLLFLPAIAVIVNVIERVTLASAAGYLLIGSAIGTGATSIAVGAGTDPTFLTRAAAFWLLTLLFGIGVAWLAAATDPAFAAVTQHRALQPLDDWLDRRPAWQGPLFAGLLSGALVAAIVIAMGAALVAAFVAAAFVMGLNLLAWALDSHPPGAVLRRLAGLAVVAAIIVVAIPPSPTLAFVLTVTLVAGFVVSLAPLPADGQETI